MATFTVQPVTVAEFIKFLQQQPQTALVAYGLYSEQCLLELSDVEVKSFSAPRADGWVQEGRPDHDPVVYLRLPGN